MQYQSIQNLVQSRLADDETEHETNLVSISFRLSAVETARLDVLAKHLSISRSQLLVDLLETVLPEIHGTLESAYDKNGKIALKADIQAAMEALS